LGGRVGELLLLLHLGRRLGRPLLHLGGNLLGRALLRHLGRRRPLRGRALLRLRRRPLDLLRRGAAAAASAAAAAAGGQALGVGDSAAKARGQQDGSDGGGGGGGGSAGRAARADGGAASSARRRRGGAHFCVSVFRDLLGRDQSVWAEGPSLYLNVAMAGGSPRGRRVKSFPRGGEEERGR